MAALRIRRQRNFQPQQRLEIDLADEVAQGLVGYWIPVGNNLVSLIPGVPDAVLTANGTIALGPKGFKLGSSSTAMAASIPHDPRYKPTGAMTVLMGGDMPTAASNFFGTENSNDGWGCYNSAIADPMRVYMRVGSAWADVATGINASTSGQVGFSYDGSTFYPIANGARGSGQSIGGAITQSSLGIGLNAKNSGGTPAANGSFRYFAIWMRALPPDHLAKFYANENRVIKAPQLRLVTPQAATPVDGSTTIATAVAGAAGSGRAASVSLPLNIACSTGSVSASAQPAAISLPLVVAASAAAESASGQAATIALSTVIACSAGAATASGLTAQVPTATTISATTASATATGQTASVSTGSGISCTTAGVQAFGLTASIVIPTTINCAPAGTTAFGLTAGIVLPSTISSARATSAASGFAASVSLPTVIGCAPAGMAASGRAAQIALPTAIAATTASMAAQGKTASITLSGVQPVSIQASSVSPSHTVVFEGGKHVVAFEGGRHVVAFAGCGTRGVSRTVRF